MAELALRWSILVPVVVALVLLLPMLQPWRGRVVGANESADSTGENDRVRHGWMLPLALGLVYALTHLGLRENWRLAFPPADVKLYLAYVVPIVVLLAVLVFEMNWSHLWLRLLVAAMVFGGYFPLLLGKMLTANYSTPAFIAWLAGLMVGAVLLTMCLASVSRTLTGRLFVFLLGSYVALSAGLFTLMGSLTSGEQLGGLASFLGILWLLLAWKRETRRLCGIGFISLFILIGNASEVYFFSYAIKPTLPLTLWLSVPIAWWVILHFWGETLAARKAWLRVTALMLAVILPMLSAGIVVYRANAADAATGADDGWEYEEFN